MNNETINIGGTVVGISGRLQGVQAIVIFKLDRVMDIKLDNDEKIGVEAKHFKLKEG